MSGSVLERTEARNLMETMGGIEAGGTQENLNKFLGSWTLSVGEARPHLSEKSSSAGCLAWFSTLDYRSFVQTRLAHSLAGEEGLRSQLCRAGSKNEGSAIKLFFRQQPFLTYQPDLLPPRSDVLQVKL